MNPFIIKDYSGPACFCNRLTEIERLNNVIDNQRNVTLSSIRKMGKTGLIHHLFHLLGQQGNFEPIYFDIYFTESLSGFINKFGTSLLSVKETFSERMKRKIEEFIRSIRPTVTYDRYSGSPVFSFSLENESAGIRTLDEIFGFLNERSKDKPIVVAIDEFQQIANYPETNVEALLRSKIQQLANVTFIFSGSDKQMLTSIFADAKRPFYQSTEFMHLEQIPEEEYRQFVTANFSTGSIAIDNAAVDKIFELTRRHTYYVQFLCNRLFGSGNVKIEQDTVLQTLSDIFKENEVYYAGYRELLTKQQWNLLIALAKEEGISKVTSGTFIKEHDLSNNATVRRGIQALLDKKFIYKLESKYFVQDVFLAQWLKSL